MSVDVTFTVAGEAYYVIAITNSRDAVNEFFCLRYRYPSCRRTQAVGLSGKECRDPIDR